MNQPENLSGNWNYPTLIRFGCGRIAELATICQEFGFSNPLLVTDPSLAENLIFNTAKSILDEASVSYQVFSDIQANPIGQNVMDGVALYQHGKHDGVVAFGGGSALDAAKAIALMAGQKRPLWDFEDREDWFTRVNIAGVANVIAIPTTAGTGSEVGRASVITDERDHVKKIIFHPLMMPVCVIADPELTVGLPANVTAAVGMDALSHSLEAYCSPVFHPLAEGIALEGMRRIKQWLPMAYHEGDNLSARANMLIAASMGATAFQKGLGAMHALSHPCSAVLGTHHGLTNAVLMPYVLKFNRELIEAKMTILSRLLDLPESGFDAILHWVLALRAELNIPHTLSELGVKAENVQQLAEMAFNDPSLACNPIAATITELQHILLAAINGD